METLVCSVLIPESVLVPAQHGGRCQWRPPPLVLLTAGVRMRRWRGSRALRPRSPCTGTAPCRASAAAAAAARKRRGSGASPGSFLNERSEKRSGIVKVRRLGIPENVHRFTQFLITDWMKFKIEEHVIELWVFDFSHVLCDESKKNKWNIFWVTTDR